MAVTLKIICSVVPREICGEILAGFRDPALAFERFAVGVKDNLILSWNLDTHSIIHIANHRLICQRRRAPI
jgi:hypothetical protein